MWNVLHVECVRYGFELTRLNMECVRFECGVCWIWNALDVECFGYGVC